MTNCKRCGGPMRPGIALGQTLTGSPDFPGGEVVTMSPGGPGRVIGCMKCAACGHSIRSSIACPKGDSAMSVALLPAVRPEYP